MTRTVYRTCNLCEAMCGLKLDVEGERIVSVRPDEEDVFSKGHICPKGVALAEVHHDPDRLRTPVRRTPSGDYEPISWEEAFNLVASRLLGIRERYGADAIATYMGNPIVHNHGALLMRNGFLKALGTKNSYSAGSQDTSPRFAASYYLYGNSLAIPVPDIDRTRYFLCIGANPLISQGSAFTAPNVKGRIRAVRERGGKVVVVDPRRSETAKEADEYVSIRPGADAAFLLAMVRVLVERGRIDRAQVERIASGWREVEQLLEPFTPERVAAFSGVPAATIERLALEFADAPTAVAYTRIGVCNNRFGTLASYATDLLNAAGGRLGAVGGAMFTTPAIDLGQIARLGKMDGHARWRSRVRNLPETLGDLPAATLADEIETEGQGQVRALVTFAGNPILSVPNGQRLAAAFERLDFMVSIDLYVNETTRFADVILPPAWSLAEDHLDLIASSVAVRNIARWSPPVFPRQDGQLADWQILKRIAEDLGGGPTGMPWMDRFYRWGERAGLGWEPTKMLGLFLRIGKHGDHFLPWSSGLNLKKLRQAPHGIDLGALEPGVERRVVHADRRVHLAAPVFVEGIAALGKEITARRSEGELLLVGRRELRTNNSWMHNLPSLVSGRERCVLYVHPEDAAPLGVRDGEAAILESRVHTGQVKVRVTDEMRPGVVSLPHGWGHAASARWQSVAGKHAGVSVNDWTDDGEVESIVGQSILNGVPVRLRAAAHDARSDAPSEALAAAAEA
jgi:anaerobic selenocysteine-containing dehydrogenase